MPVGTETATSTRGLQYESDRSPTKTKMFPTSATSGIGFRRNHVRLFAKKLCVCGMEGGNDTSRVECSMTAEMCCCSWQWRRKLVSAKVRQRLKERRTIVTPFCCVEGGIEKKCCNAAKEYAQTQRVERTRSHETRLIGHDGTYGNNDKTRKYLHGRSRPTNQPTTQLTSIMTISGNPPISANLCAVKQKACKSHPMYTAR